MTQNVLGVQMYRLAIVGGTGEAGVREQVHKPNQGHLVHLIACDTLNHTLKTLIVPLDAVKGTVNQLCHALKRPTPRQGVAHVEIHDRL